MDHSNIRISLIALGCSKNLVDAECMVKNLKDAGFDVVNDIDNTDVVIINTCGFIESAKKEAIDTILSCADLKEEGKISKIVVTGCLSQRYPDDILKEMPEVDAVVGTAHYQDIVSVIDRLMDEEKIKCVSEAGSLEHLDPDKEVSTTGFAWIKIGIPVTPLVILKLLVFLLTASLFMIALMNFAAATCFWIKGSGYVMVIMFRFKDFAKYPSSIFEGIFKIIFTFIIPIAFIAYYPSLVILEPSNVPILSWISPFYGILFVYLSYRFWMLGVRKYDFTGS